MTKFDSNIKKQRHHFASQSCIVKTLIFPIVMYECESCAIKKADKVYVIQIDLIWCERELYKEMNTRGKDLCVSYQRLVTTTCL